MILVTGSSGFVGYSLMRALANSGQEAVRFSGRINDPYALRKELEGIETVIHLVTAEAQGSIRRLQHVDVEGTERLLEEAIRANVNHLIFTSRLGADPNAMFAVLRTKGEIEKLIQESGIPYTIIRSSTLFGRNDRFLNAIASLAVWNWPFVWLPAGGKNVLQPFWVEDLIRCILIVSDPLDLQGHRGQIYTVAGEERLHYDEIVRLVLAATGLKRKPLPARMLFVRGVTNLFFSWHGRQMVNRFFLDRLAVPEIAELDVVLRTFGFRPNRLRDHLTYLRQTGIGWRVFDA